MPLQIEDAQVVTTTTGRLVNSSVINTWANVQATPVAKPMSKPPKPVNPVIVTALRDLKVWREERKRIAENLRRRLALQSQSVTTYPRHYETAAEYKAATLERSFVGPLKRFVPMLDRTCAVLAPPEYVTLVNKRRSQGPYTAEQMAPLDSVQFRLALKEAARASGLVGADRLQRIDELAAKLNLYTCPLTGEYLLSRRVPYGAGHTGPRQELIDAGACVGPKGEWYRSNAERVIALKLREVILIRNGHLQKRELSEADIQTGTLRRMPDGRDVLLLPNVNGIADYHSGIQDVSYDDAPRHVGIEIEVNAGSHSEQERQRIAAEILLATSGRVKIERDGSVTGFELITGHGKPSSVRQALATVFRQKLLSGFRTARTTGAHVHVTAPGDENYKVAQSPGYYKALLPFYRSLGERANGRHCRAGMHHGRYSEINVETGRGTVEFRLFKSQLKLAKLIRNAQFAWAYMELLGQYVPDSTEEAVRAKFLEGLADLPREETVELRAWMAAHGHKVPHVATDLRRLYRGLGVTAAMG